MTEPTNRPNPTANMEAARLQPDPTPLSLQISRPKRLSRC